MLLTVAGGCVKIARERPMENNRKIRIIVAIFLFVLIFFPLLSNGVNLLVVSTVLWKSKWS